MRALIAFISAFAFLLSYALAQKEAVLNEEPVSDKIEYKSVQLKDPFQVDALEIGKIKQESAPKEKEPSEVKPLPPLEIQGIVWGGRFPQAIINRKVVKIGDTIGEVRITDISQNGVTAFFENRQYNLSSPASQGVIKKKPQGGKGREAQF